MMIDKLIKAIQDKNNPTVAGLDTRMEYFPDGFSGDISSFSQAADALVLYNKGLIDALYDVVPAVKLQAAYYEMYSIEGMRAFWETAKYAKQKGMLVIADVKRGDIGATAEAYAQAYLGETQLAKKHKAFDMDFVTVNPYLGKDGIEPFVNCCKEYDKGIFVLVKTSNPSSGELQDLECQGKPIYEIMGEHVMEWGQGLIGESGYSSVGAVVGATYPQQGERLRDMLSSVFFLVPGYGAQGGAALDLAKMFDKNGSGAIVNASRSILMAHKKGHFSGMDYQMAARKEAIRMQDDINSHI